MIGDAAGVNTPRSIPLPSSAYFSEPAWSPDGKQMLLEDNHTNLWTIEIAGGRAAKVDTEQHPDPGRSMNAVWSPDSKYIAYAKNLPSYLRAIFIYSVAEGKAHQITDGLADSISPAFDAGGKYLYFLVEHGFWAAHELGGDERAGSARPAGDLSGDLECGRPFAAAAGDCR